MCEALSGAARGSSAGRRQAWTRGALVVSEVAFACTLLVTAGLLIRSFVRVLDVDLGFRPDRAWALRIDPGARYSSQEKRNAYFDEALLRVRPLPGVRGAALADVLPFGGNRSGGVVGEGQVYARDEYPQAFIRVVSDGYFQTMGIPLKAGRDFGGDDDPSREQVVIVNERLARMLWPGQDPLGRILLRGGKRRVVGVVGDVRHAALEDDFTGELYFPIRQSDDYARVELVVRSDLAPVALARGVRAAMAPIAPELPASAWRPLRELVAKAASPRRFVVLVLGGFSGFALLLASLGIFGVVSYSVSQSTREIGIRMALGAQGSEVRRGILTRTLALAGFGVGLGAAASWTLGRAIESQLYGVAASDPVTFGGSAALVVLVTALAGYFPARHASRVDPVAALRAG